MVVTKPIVVYVTKGKGNNMKISIAKKIMSLSIIPLFLMVVISSVGSAIFLGSSTLDEIEKELRLSVYAVEKETEQMSAANTSGTTVQKLIDDFYAKNDIDITIFDKDVRVFSTIKDAEGKPIVDTKMDAAIYEDIQDGDTFFSKDANVNGQRYYAFYEPVMKNGVCVGAFFAGEPSERVDKIIIGNMLKMAGVSMSVGIIMIVLSVLVARRIAKKLDDLKVRFNTLAENDLSIKYDVKTVEYDEIDTLCNKSAGFTEQLKSIVGKIKNGSTDLKEISSELKKDMQLTKDTCSQISEVMEHVADGAASQAEETGNITNKVNTMYEELTDIKDNTNNLSSVAETMNTAKNNALNTLNELQKVNDAMMVEVNATNEQVNTTSESVNHIQQFVEVIKNIANQTNLLSLNASIEAAKAGGAGRGFAVVAENIRNLAEQSAESSGDIEKILAELEKNYGKTITSVEKVSESMNEQNKKLSETIRVFGSLETGINETVGGVENINDKVIVLDTELKTIVDAISNLSAISQENSAATQETMASIQELTSTMEEVNEKAMVVNDSADTLIDEVNIFKVE